MKYVYPAIFQREGNLYSVIFPDFDCATSGEGLAEAMEMAKDALCLTLYDMEERSVTPPKPSDLRQVTAGDGGIVSLVACDTVEYRKFYDGKAVKKTLTIPNWLNTLSEREGLNFSQVLQEGLKNRLGL